MSFYPGTSDIKWAAKPKTREELKKEIEQLHELIKGHQLDIIGCLDKINQKLEEIRCLPIEETRQEPKLTKFIQCGAPMDLNENTIVACHQLIASWVVRLFSKDKHYVKDKPITCHMGNSCNCVTDASGSSWRSANLFYLQNADFFDYEYANTGVNPDSKTSGHQLLFAVLAAYNIGHIKYYKTKDYWDATKLDYYHVAEIQFPIDPDADNCDEEGDHLYVTTHRESDMCKFMIRKICKNFYGAFDTRGQMQFIIKYRGEEMPLVMPIHPGLHVRKIK